jgi:putative inorganic carbon (HCO3(-)) transporter
MDPSFAVGDAAEKLGVVVLGCTTAMLLTSRQPARRAAAMTATLVIASILLIGHIWNTAQFRSISGDAIKFAGLLLLGLAAVAGLAALFKRRVEAFPLLAVAVLPFRVPIEAGGTTSNLLVPLYLVIAGGVVAHVWDLTRERRKAPVSAPQPVRILEVALAIFVVLYSIQSLYSNDFSTALQQIVFFYVPFALLFRLLAEVDWSRSLLAGCLGVLALEAVVFSAIGFWEYDHRELIWNPKVIHANQFSSYFRVNSVFWDPSIFGRFLVIVMLALTATMLWTSRPRAVAAAAVVLPVLWGGLVLTLSQSSISALLAGLAALAALRWDARRVAVTTALGLALAALFVVAFQGTLRVHLGSSAGVNRATSGRGNLIRGGLDLFAERPIWGHGSGSFARSYRREHKGSSQQAVSASHTIPLTVAAEQGIVGLGAYLLVLLASFQLLLGKRLPVFRRRAPPAEDARRDGKPPARPEHEVARDAPSGDETFQAAQAALVAAFTALVVHTMAYAAFLEDPFTWVILAAGAGIVPSFAWAAARAPTPTTVEPAPTTA